MEHRRVTSTMLQTAAVCVWGSVQGSYAWRKVESQLLDKLRSCFWFGYKKISTAKSNEGTQWLLFHASHTWNKYPLSRFLPCTWNSTSNLAIFPLYIFIPSFTCLPNILQLCQFWGCHDNTQSHFQDRAGIVQLYLPSFNWSINNCSDSIMNHKVLFMLPLILFLRQS